MNNSGRMLLMSPLCHYARSFRATRQTALLARIQTLPGFGSNGIRSRLFASKDDKPPCPCVDTTPSPPCPPPCEPPPCPPPPPPCGPPCPPPICVMIPDPNNPCNYVPPKTLRPGERDLTKLKKYQCLYQNDPNDVYLKGGKSAAYAFQAAALLTGSLFIYASFCLYSLL